MAIQWCTDASAVRDAMYFQASNTWQYCCRMWLKDVLHQTLMGSQTLYILTLAPDLMS
jgi:hypothetical protein